MKRPIRAMALVILLVSSSAFAQAPCENDSACEPGQVCSSGQCAAPAPPKQPGRCQDDLDCHGDQSCTAGRCQRSPPAPTRAVREESEAGGQVVGTAEEPSSAPRMKRNTGLMVGGIVCAGAGGLALLTGVMMLAMSGAESTQVCSGNDCHPATESDREGMKTAGTVASVVGVGLVVIGIPMIAIGAKKRPVGAASGGSLAVMVGPTNAALRGSF